MSCGSKTNCTCGCKAKRRLGFRDPRYTGRLGDTPNASDFFTWLNQQPLDLQNLFYADQAANPGDLVNTPTPASSTAVNWTLGIVAGLAGFFVLDAVLGSGGGRRRR